jgi:hypothetical protein
VTLFFIYLSGTASHGRWTASQSFKKSKSEAVYCFWEQILIIFMPWTNIPMVWLMKTTPCVFILVLFHSVHIRGVFPSHRKLRWTRNSREKEKSTIRYHLDVADRDRFWNDYPVQSVIPRIHPHNRPTMTREWRRIVTHVLIDVLTLSGVCQWWCTMWCSCWYLAVLRPW